MASTLYRRQSMAQLYEKLRAQGDDDDDDTAWLAQYGQDVMLDEPYVPATINPAALSTVSSPSPVPSSAPSVFDTGFGNESSDDDHSYPDLGLDSDSDVDPESLSPCMASVASSSSSSISQPDDLDIIEPSDPPYVPWAREVSPPGSRSTSPSVGSPEPMLLAPSIASRCTTRPVRKSSSATSHSLAKPHDAYGDVYSESDDNDSEDEYIPSPTLGPRKRHRSSRPASNGASPRKRTNQGTSCQRPRQSPLPRNAQAAPGTTPATSVEKTDQWACPHCKWVQRNHRTPDLKRHIRTHTRLQRPARWVCCGVPVQDAKYYNVPDGAVPYHFGEEEMIGGCCREFSRRDALKRHLDNDHIHCVGDFTAFANICEDED